jgi:hypothetical protein
MMMHGLANFKLSILYMYIFPTILCSVTLFFRNRAVYKKNVEKYCTAGQATDYSMVHAHCMLDTQGYKYRHPQ